MAPDCAPKKLHMKFSETRKKNKQIMELFTQEHYIAHVIPKKQFILLEVVSFIGEDEQISTYVAEKCNFYDYHLVALSSREQDRDPRQIRIMNEIFLMTCWSLIQEPSLLLDAYRKFAIMKVRKTLVLYQQRNNKRQEQILTTDYQTTQQEIVN